MLRGLRGVEYACWECTVVDKVLKKRTVARAERGRGKDVWVPISLVVTITMHPEPDIVRSRTAVALMHTSFPLSG